MKRNERSWEKIVEENKEVNVQEEGFCASPKLMTSNILSALSSEVVASNRPSGLTDMSEILPARAQCNHSKLNVTSQQC